MGGEMNKSVLLVGNGASIKDSNLGSKIDEFDEIIRINNWKTKLFEKDAGSRTTIWAMYNPLKCATSFINGYREMGLTFDEIKGIVKDINEIWYVCWNPENILYSWKKNQSIKDIDIYNRCKRHISIQTSKKIRKVTNPPSTGFSLIWILSHMYDKIYIVGFDFAGEMNPNTIYHHYYGNKLSEVVKSRDIHHMKVEADYVRKQIKENKIIYLTKDTHIEKAIFIGNTINKKICKNCNNTNNLMDWEMAICNHCEAEIDG